MTLTCCQDHILTENIWFVWSETSYSGDERRCYRCGTNKRMTNTEDRVTQPNGSWRLSFAIFLDRDPCAFIHLGNLRENCTCQSEAMLSKAEPFCTTSVICLLVSPPIGFCITNIYTTQPCSTNIHCCRLKPNCADSIFNLVQSRWFCCQTIVSRCTAAHNL